MRCVSEWHAKDLQYLIGASIQSHIMLHNGNETVCTDGSVNLYSDSILSSTPEFNRTAVIEIMKKVMMTLMAVVFAITVNAQYSTNYYNKYGSSIGSSSTRSNYGGGYTTNYYD